MNGSNRQELDGVDTVTPAGRREHAALIRMYEVFDQDHDRLCAELLAALPAEQPRRAIRTTLTWPMVGDFLMNRVFTRRGITLLAPAACVALAAAVNAEAGLVTLAGIGAFLAVFLHKPFDSLTIGTLMAADGR